MRHRLAEREGVRGTFHGTFVRFGWKRDFGYDKQTVLLNDVRDDCGKKMTDHLWFNLTKGFERCELRTGDIVEFDARVTSYIKGYMGRRDDVWDCPIEEDHRLSHPTKVRLLSRNNRTQ